jgi:hypothetical protein
MRPLVPGFPVVQTRGRYIGLSSVTRYKRNLTAEFLAAEGDKDLQAPDLKRWTYRRCYRAALSCVS